jgi:hypothetical protein
MGLAVFFEFCIVQEIWIFKDAGPRPWPWGGSSRLQLQFGAWTSTPIVNMVRYDFIDLNELFKNVPDYLLWILHRSGAMIFKDAGPAPGPQLEVQVSTWTSTPIAEMVWYDFVRLFTGYKKVRHVFSKFCMVQKLWRLKGKEKLFFRKQKKKSLSSGRFQSEISPELCRIERKVPEQLF